MLFFKQDYIFCIFVQNLSPCLAKKTSLVKSFFAKHFPLDNIPFSLLFISRYKVVSKEQGCSKGNLLFYKYEIRNPKFKTSTNVQNLNDPNISKALNL